MTSWNPCSTRALAVTGDGTTAIASYLDTRGKRYLRTSRPWRCGSGEEASHHRDGAARKAARDSSSRLSRSPSGRVLDVVNCPLIVLRLPPSLHENLTVPDYWAAPSWAGRRRTCWFVSLTRTVAVVAANGVLRAGLRWRRAGDASISNLHYLPRLLDRAGRSRSSPSRYLSLVPQTARSPTSAIAPDDPQAAADLAAQIGALRRSSPLTPRSMLRAARSRLAAERIVLATLQSERGERSERPRPQRAPDRSERAAATWRVAAARSGQQRCRHRHGHDRDRHGAQPARSARGRSPRRSGFAPFTRAAAAASCGSSRGSDGAFPQSRGHGIVMWLRRAAAQQWPDA